MITVLREGSEKGVMTRLRISGKSKWDLTMDCAWSIDRIWGESGDNAEDEIRPRLGGLKCQAKECGLSQAVGRHCSFWAGERHADSMLWCYATCAQQ